jgi:hypothetical protein
VSAQDDAPFNCHLRVGSLTYDLTTLGETSNSRTRDTPPTTMVDTLSLNLCEDLKVREDVAESDQVCVLAARRHIFNFVSVSKWNASVPHKDK